MINVIVKEYILLSGFQLHWPNFFFHLSVINYYYGAAAVTNGIASHPNNRFSIKEVESFLFTDHHLQKF